MAESSYADSSERRCHKVAFLGGGFDSAVGRVHRIAVEMDDRFELVAGCFSREPGVGAQSAAKYGLNAERVYDSLERLLEAERDNIDAIVILTPTDQHFQQVESCLSAGLPVICEKALVATSDEALKIKRRVDSADGFLTVTYNYTGYPMLRELKHIIAEGRLGEIHDIHLEMPQEGFARVGSNGAPVVPQQWRLRDGQVPTISLDLGVHLHMMVRFLTAETPREVVAISGSNGNFRQVIDNISCLATYTNGLSCNIWYSKTALGYRNGLKVRVFGQTGSAEWLQEDPEHLRLADNRGNRYVLDRGGNDVAIANEARYNRFKAGHPAGFIEAFANYYVDVADALDAHHSSVKLATHGYVFGAQEALEGISMLEAIARSSHSNRWEAVSWDS